MQTYVKSVLDNDFYKFTMANAIWSKPEWRDLMAVYEFKCRTQGIDWTPYVDQIKQAIQDLEQLPFEFDHFKYLDGLRVFKESFLTTIFKTNTFHKPSKLEVYVDNDRQLQIKLTAPWMWGIFYEVPVLSIVNQVYADSIAPDENKAWKRLENGLAPIVQSPMLAKDYATKYFTLVDFGTRRRRSFEWQEKVVLHCREHLYRCFAGTSNVHLAHKYKLKPFGTMAHEWIMAGQVLAPGESAEQLKNSQKYMLLEWARINQGKLGIALSDTLGFDKFLADFDGYLARLYDGTRHDSGDPQVWAQKLIQHYRNLGINPKHKTAVFSDGLTLQKAWDLHLELIEDINCSFGIGTKLTNDFDYPNGPLNIVMKLTALDGKPLAKLSDTPGKTMCRDEAYLKQLREAIHG